MDVEGFDTVIEIAEDVVGAHSVVAEAEFASLVKK